jgi:hypothetical protein
MELHEENHLLPHYLTTTRYVPWNTVVTIQCTLIKKKIKFSSYIRKLTMEQLQNHMWLTASSYIGKYLRISSYIRKSFLIYDFATAPLWISLYMWSKSFVSFCQPLPLNRTNPYSARVENQTYSLLIAKTYLKILYKEVIEQCDFRAKFATSWLVAQF